MLSSLNQEIRLLAALIALCALEPASLALRVSKLPRTRLLAAFTFNHSPRGAPPGRP